MNDSVRNVTRRHFLTEAGAGLGAVALTGLFGREAQAGTGRRPHFAPRAKNVIYLHMVGAPSHLDLFDYKPMLQKHHGQLLPEELWKGLRLAFIRKRPHLLGPHSWRDA